MGQKFLYIYKYIIRDSDSLNPFLTTDVNLYIHKNKSGDRV